MRNGHVINGLTLSTALGVIALVIGILNLSSQTDTLTKSLQQSSYRSCELIVGILHSFHTPQGRASARIILSLNPELENCTTYANHFK